VRGLVRLPLVSGLLLAFVAGISVWFGILYDDRIGWVRHSLKVENALSELFATLQGAETGHRGYLLSGDPSFLEPYERARASIAARLQETAALTMDNAAQQQAIGELAGRIDQRMADLAAGLDDYAQGRIQAAIDRVRSGRGRLQTEAIRTRIDLMREAEAELLAVRTAAADRMKMVLLVTVAGACLLTFLFTLGWVRSTSASARALQAAYRQAATANAGLEATIAERTRALRESHENLRVVLESAIDYAIITTDLNGRITAWSRGAEAILGYGREEVIEREIGIVFTPEDRSDGIPELEIGQALARERSAAERWYQAKDGRRLWAGGETVPLRHEDGRVLGFLKIMRDRTTQRRAEEQQRDFTATLEERVSERTAELAKANRTLLAEAASREAAEAQVRQMQKMEAVGQLTGGIAHDFNNMMAVVIGSLNLMRRRRARGDQDIDRFIDAALDGASRAATLTARLLAFSRQQPLAPEPIDANRLVSGMSELLRRTLGEAVRIETVLAAGLWRTHADVSQVENAIVNLAVNARDAMPAGGKLTIETANVHFDDAYVARNVGVPPGQYVMIALSDTGTGMAPEVMARAFDPFFTTKGVGKGTGLGLSQVYGFVRQSGGEVKIYSEPGAGTTVKIYLPRFFGSEESLPAATALHGPVQAGSPQEIILVVEDEERVRQFTVEALRELGYTVLHADGGAAALRLLDSHPEVRLLMTDIIMPDMNGRALADEAARRMPTLRVLYMTGFTRNAVVHNGMLDPGVNFIAKPFSIDQLAAKVREALDPPG